VELFGCEMHVLLGENTSVPVGVGWRETSLAPRPFSDLLCVPTCFIPPAVPYLWQSALPYI